MNKMITIKSKAEIELMKIAGRVTGETLKRVEEAVKPGVTTNELNKIAEDYIRSQGCLPSFKGYGGFPATVCASVNDVIIHGFPNNEPLREGDVVSIDVGACWKGYHGDAARTFAVGKVSDEAQRLIDVTKESFFEGLKFCKESFRVSDISKAVQDFVEENGFSVLRDFCGHGIGAEMHEDPEIPNYVSKRERGARLKNGMCIAVEPMVCQGKKDYFIADDGWAVFTKDGKLSAHYENSILITDGEPLLLTYVD